MNRVFFNEKNKFNISLCLIFQLFIASVVQACDVVTLNTLNLVLLLKEILLCLHVLVLRVNAQSNNPDFCKLMTSYICM